MEFEKQADQKHLAPEFESLSENIIDKGPEVNVEASAIQTELDNRTTSQSQQEYLNETTPEKTDKDVTTENAEVSIVLPIFCSLPITVAEGEQAFSKITCVEQCFKRAVQHQTPKTPEK
ncbi:hypothetical protein JTB14_014542 [Gonioctena quinquepunctata]|nr:hypothetical protein JTB14_014542 [Gonioctena quinquepunctata]